MSQVAIEKYKNSETIPPTFLERVASITDSIRQRAFNLFQNREGGNGSDLDDWLQAERDVAWLPASELVEDEKELRARIAVPGFDAKDIQVSAMPDALSFRPTLPILTKRRTAKFASASFRKSNCSGGSIYPRRSMSTR